jgi:hypothetical protein
LHQATALQRWLPEKLSMSGFLRLNLVHWQQLFPVN